MQCWTIYSESRCWAGRGRGINWKDDANVMESSFVLPYQLRSFQSFRYRKKLCHQTSSALFMGARCIWIQCYAIKPVRCERKWPNLLVYLWWCPAVFPSWILTVIRSTPFAPTLVAAGEKHLPLWCISDYTKLLMGFFATHLKGGPFRCITWQCLICILRGQRRPFLMQSRN